MRCGVCTHPCRGIELHGQLRRTRRPTPRKRNEDTVVKSAKRGTARISFHADVSMNVLKYSGYTVADDTSRTRRILNAHVAEADYEWATELNRFGLTLLDIWPRKNETKRKRLISQMCIFIVMNVAFWGCAVPSLHSLFKIWGDLMSVIDNLQYLLPFLTGLMKQSILWYKRKDILPLLNMIREDWLRPKTPQERSIMLKCARIARILTIFGYFIMFASFILTAVLPIFGISIRYLTNRTDPGRQVPMQTYYIYDRDKSPFYEITYFMQSFTFVVLAIMYTGTDNFLSLLVFHVCGQLENLKIRIAGLDRYDDFEDAVSRNVRVHKRLIRFINTIDDIFNLMLLGVLVSFGALFALYGFLFGTMMAQGRNVSVARLIFILTVSINTFAHTCLYCAVGEILVAQCEAVYRAVYEYEWYTLEPRRAKKLLMIMIRANKPLYLTAGKLLPMTMATFCNMLKTSAGYISVLLAYRE